MSWLIYFPHKLCLRDVVGFFVVNFTKIFCKDIIYQENTDYLFLEVKSCDLLALVDDVRVVITELILQQIINWP